MAKTKNISLRFDEDDLKLALDKSGFVKNQKLFDFLLSEYVRQFKKTLITKLESVGLKISIYSLTNPINNEVFYVGKTISPLEQRLKAHLKESQDNAKSEKREVIKAITDLNLLPVVGELESYECFCAEDELKINEREKYWIEFYSETAKNVIGIKQPYKNKATIKNFNSQKPTNQPRQIEPPELIGMEKMLGIVDIEKQIAAIQSEVKPSIIPKANWERSKQRRVSELQNQLK